METATKNLETDHIHILRLIDIMEKAIKNPLPNFRNLELMVDLIKNYADGFHHAKEENHLFPLMTKRGFSIEQGPIAVMLHEHVLGREFVKGMAENLENSKNGNQAAIDLVYKNMLGYIELLRGHIHKENNILFRMADNAFSEKDQQDLLVQFAQIEESALQGNTLNDFIDQIEDLRKVYELQ